MNKSITVTGLACGLLAAPFLCGCTNPAQDPLAAASGAAKLAAVEGQGLDALGNVIANELSASELASMVNLGLGKDWTLDDANAIMGLLGQIDEGNAQALEDANIDGGNVSAQGIQDAFNGAGIPATDQQAQLLKDLFDAI